MTARPEPQPPACDEAAEQAVLGAMILEPPAVIPRMRAALLPADFYSEVHRRIFEGLLAASDDGEPVDLVTLQALLRDRGLLDAVGGQSYLARLLDACPTAAGADRYARIVREKARLRQIETVARRALERVAEGQASAEVIEAFRAGLNEVAEAEALDACSAMRVGEFLDAELPAPLWIAEGIAVGAGTTFLYGKPGVAKSFLAWEIARCVAANDKVLQRFTVCSGPAVYLNLEMPPAFLQQRLRRMEFHHPCRGAPLYVANDPLALNDPDSFARLKTLCEGIGPALVVIDPLIRALPGVDENSATEVNLALNGVINLAREMGFGLLMVHHALKGAGHHVLDLLPGTRDFAARADVCLLLRQAGEDGEGDEDAPRLVRVTVTKSRWQQTPKGFFFRVVDEGGYPALVPAEAPNAKREVMELLGAKSPLKRKEIVAELDGLKSARAVDSAIADLLAEGAIQRAGYGLYRAAWTPERPERTDV